MDFIFLTADTVVRRSRVLRVPTPSLPLRPVDKVHHLSLGRIERFQMIVVVSAVDPVCQKGQSIRLMTTDWNLKFRFILITSRGEFSNSCRRKKTTLWRNRNQYPCQQYIAFYNVVNRVYHWCCDQPWDVWLRFQPQREDCRIHQAAPNRGYRVYPSAHGNNSAADERWLSSENE